MKHYTTTLRGATFEAFCLSADTRNDFKHEVEIHCNGYFIARAKVCCINRTWERYDYETAIHKAIEKAVFTDDKAENEKLKTELKNQFDDKALSRCCC